MSKYQFIEGSVAFSKLTETDVYNGTDTGKYKLDVGIDPSFVSQLEEQGVKLKDYDGTSQRKFSSKFPVELVDSEGNAIPTIELPRGSKVRVLYTSGPAHPSFGAPTYLAKVKVLEMAETQVDAPSEF